MLINYLSCYIVNKFGESDFSTLISIIFQMSVITVSDVSEGDFDSNIIDLVFD